MKKITDFYNSFQKNDGSGKKTRSALLQMDWMSTNVQFDPKTGEPIAQPLSEFLCRISSYKPNAILHDRLWRIIEHSRQAVERLFYSLNQSPKRKYDLLPIHSVRELDSNSLIWLNRLPGRNIREKLAGVSHLKSVCRFQSVDLPENRLFKAFVLRLSEILELRKTYSFGDAEEDELYSRIQNWLYSEDARNIGFWDNPPPNNTLLSHRDYRRIWDSWRWIQTLDEDLESDFNCIEERQAIIDEWEKYSKMYSIGDYIFADIPISFNFDNFQIEPFFNTPIRFKKVENKISRKAKFDPLDCAVCVDLTFQRPRYAYKYGTKIVQDTLSDVFIWQLWKNGSEAHDINLFNSDAVFINDEHVNTISFDDLFFSADRNVHNHEGEFARAVHSFSSRLRDYFKHDELLWLVPDSLNDFELGIIRRAINANFAKAQPIPRSVAAVFEKIDYLEIEKQGFSAVVVDDIGGKICLTKLVAKFDSDLKKSLPETRGYYWERQPSFVLPANGDNLDIDEKAYDIFAVDFNNNWKLPAAKRDKFSLSVYETAKIREICGDFDRCINLSESPVIGGIKLYSLQQRHLGISLWRDRIPELSIKVRISGRYKRFYLVGENTNIRPIRGRAVEIPIKDKFILPKGKNFYSLPILIGKNDEEIGFSARLNSSQFPLKQDTRIELNLSYTYGSDEPYRLVFTPCDKSFSPIKAIWERSKEINNALAPKYPKIATWNDLRNDPNPSTGKTSDLLEWALSTCDFILGKPENKCRNHIYPEKNTKFLKNIRKNLTPFIKIWRDGRSINDIECPIDFSTEIKERLENINRYIEYERLSKNEKSELIFLLSCLHKDTTDDCINWIFNYVEKKDFYDARSVGYALGDASEYWQLYVLECLLENIDDFSIDALTYAIWREEHFVHRFTFDELNDILVGLKNHIENIKSDVNSYAKPSIFINKIRQSLELLFGLLRTRDSKDEKIKMLLQPHQKITKDFSKAIERIADILEKNNLDLKSHINLNIKKPNDVKTPDLLYALSLYLNNEDEANVISIANISED